MCLPGHLLHCLIKLKLQRNSDIRQLDLLGIFRLIKYSFGIIRFSHDALVFHLIVIFILCDLEARNDIHHKAHQRKHSDHRIDGKNKRSQRQYSCRISNDISGRDHSQRQHLFRLGCCDHKIIKIFLIVIADQINICCLPDKLPLNITGDTQKAHIRPVLNTNLDGSADKKNCNAAKYKQNGTHQIHILTLHDLNKIL